MLANRAVSFYEERILPRLINRFMSGQEFAVLRRRVVAPVAGEVLEVGFGSGLNLPYYPQGVRRLFALDPSELGRQLSRDRVQAAPFPVEWIGNGGEALPLGDRCIDWVASSWTLCTIPDVETALAEIHRVLRPGGGFAFVEHGRSPDPRVRRWQDRLTPLQKLFGGGCHLNRDIPSIIRSAGLEIEPDAMETFYMNGLKVGSHTFLGLAFKRAKVGEPRAPRALKGGNRLL